MLIMKHALPIEEITKLIKDDSVIMIGGFMGVGSPHRIIDALIQAPGGNFTIIANDTARMNEGIGKLIHANKVKKVIASHIGLNPETQAKMIANELDVELVPQGTLVERIRSAGFGLGGALVKTGLGTVVEANKQTIDIDGETWLVEKPLKADFALIHAHQSDYLGNLTYQLTATNFNPIMAMAANVVICEANEIVPIGMISPNDVITPAALVDYLVGMPIKGH